MDVHQINLLAEQLALEQSGPGTAGHWRVPGEKKVLITCITLINQPLPSYRCFLTPLQQTPFWKHSDKRINCTKHAISPFATMFSTFCHRLSIQLWRFSMFWQNTFKVVCCRIVVWGKGLKTMLLNKPNKTIIAKEKIGLVSTWHVLIIFLINEWRENLSHFLNRLYEIRNLIRTVSWIFNSFPHTTNLQQTTLKTSRQK